MAKQQMKPLSDVMPPGKTVSCPNCGGFVFFDWGLKLLHRETSGVGPRVADWAQAGNVQVCANCHHPVVWMGGDYYDAVEVIDKETIEKLIREGQARSHAVPVRAMDP